MRRESVGVFRNVDIADVVGQKLAPSLAAKQNRNGNEDQPYARCVKPASTRWPLKALSVGEIVRLASFSTLINKWVMCFRTTVSGGKRSIRLIGSLPNVSLAMVLAGGGLGADGRKRYNGRAGLGF